MIDKRKLKPSGPPPPLSPRLALGLGTAVAVVHLWLLASAPLQLGLDAAAPGPATLQFSTRQIEAPAPASAAPRPLASRPTVRLPAGPELAPSAAPPEAAPAAPDPAPEPAQASVTRPEPAVASMPTTEAAQAAPLPEQPIVPNPAPDSAPAPAQTPAPDPAPAIAQAAPEPLPPQQSASLKLPGSVRLQYALSGQARGFQYSADGLMTWQQDGQRYQARMVISAFLLLNPRIMTSAGELGPLGVSPRRFSDKARTEQATHFQPEQGRILFSSNAPEVPWRPGAQDRLSVFFQLAGMLAAEPARFVPGTQVQILTAGTREADTWTFTVVGTPTLALPAGEQATIALKRAPRREFDQTVEVWFAPALGYLPVRIRLSQANGDVVDQQLASVQPL